VLVRILKPLLHLVYSPLFWSNWLYVSNLVRPWWGNPTEIFWPQVTPTPVVLGALWSLCVEEQFYLVWPLLVLLLRSRKAIMYFSAAATVAVLCLRIGLYIHYPQKAMTTEYLYFATYTRCDGLFIGAFLAVWLRGTRLTNRAVYQVAGVLIGFPTISLLTANGIFGGRWIGLIPPAQFSYEFTLVDLACAGVLLLAVDERTFLFRTLRVKGLAALGVISYGFYFFHGLPYLFIQHANVHFFAPYHLSPVLPLLVFAVTYLCAHLSYYYYEAYFLKLKNRLAPGHRSVPSGVEAGATLSR